MFIDFIKFSNWRAYFAKRLFSVFKATCFFFEIEEVSVLSAVFKAKVCLFCFFFASTSFFILSSPLLFPKISSPFISANYSTPSYHTSCSSNSFKMRINNSWLRRSHCFRYPFLVFSMVIPDPSYRFKRAFLSTTFFIRCFP